MLEAGISINRNVGIAFAEKFPMQTRELIVALADINQILNNAGNFSRIYTLALERAANWLGVQNAAVWLRRQENSSTDLVAVARSSATAGPSVTERMLRRWWSDADQCAISDEAIARSETVAHARAQAASANHTGRTAPASRAAMIICTPILSPQNKAVGALGIELLQATDDDCARSIEFLQLIAAMFARAWQMQQLLAQTTTPPLLPLLDEDVGLRDELGLRYDFSHIIGNSGPMRQVYEQIAQVACTKATVLITGESGTGKELIAHALHTNSPRLAGAFIKVNCGALPETLIESELFGHERGAFTGAHVRRQGRFELAHGGTLFLDEVGELSAAAQVKLLRVLQEGELERVGGEETVKVDVRLIAATNRDLEKEVAAGRFRADLFYRLNLFPIMLPSLRERREDILPLAEHFLVRYARKLEKPARRFSPQATALLQTHDWPGNVRELENAIERAAVVADGQTVEHYHLPPVLQTARATSTSLDGAPNGNLSASTLAEAVATYERTLICDALRTTRGKRAQAAKLLGLSERLLAYKIKKHQIDNNSFQ